MDQLHLNTVLHVSFTKVNGRIQRKRKSLFSTEILILALYFLKKLHLTTCSISVADPAA